MDNINYENLKGEIAWIKLNFEKMKLEVLQKNEENRIKIENMQNTYQMHKDSLEFEKNMLFKEIMRLREELAKEKNKENNNVLFSNSNLNSCFSKPETKSPFYFPQGTRSSYCSSLYCHKN